jgi:uncharacterized DUF497 family protein
VRFEWDLSKESENLRKHGVSFIEAVSTFSDPIGIQVMDEAHSDLESRYYWIGKSSNGRILTTRFTLREDTIRIFGSADWRKFRRLYYEAAKT